MRNTNDGITALFGNPFKDHKVTVFVPKKIRKEETKGQANSLYGKMTRWFGSASYSESHTSFMQGGKQIYEETYNLESFFCATDKNDLVALKNLQNWCMSFADVNEIKGVLVSIDSRLYWVTLGG